MKKLFVILLLAGNFAHATGVHTSRSGIKNQVKMQESQDFNTTRSNKDKSLGLAQSNNGNTNKVQDHNSSRSHGKGGPTKK